MATIAVMMKETGFWRACRGGGGGSWNGSNIVD
jgi:hypothetical protein